LFAISRNFYLVLYLMLIAGVVAWGPFIESDLTVFVFVLAGWVASIAVHEFGHALAARRAGDTSTGLNGYLTLNPLAYADPISSLVLPLVVIALAGIGLPGATVYVERRNVRTKAQLSFVAAAGPIATLCVLALLALPFLLGIEQHVGSSFLWGSVGLLAFFQATALVINLLPLPGLDGYGVIEPYLPEHIRHFADAYAQFFMLGLFTLFILVPPASQVVMILAFNVIDHLGIHPGWAMFGLSHFQFWRNYM